MTVGPDSAGAFPGPVCYSRGGTVPTVTDAQLVLGYLDPDNFAGGRMKLDKESATKALAELGARIGMTAMQCAAGICRIVELQMADVIRKVTVEKGFDPRDFVLFAFGGAGPAHAGVFAAELGVRKVVIPRERRHPPGAPSAPLRPTCCISSSTPRSCRPRLRPRASTATSISWNSRPKR
jgi:N-methylhydantoinase A